MDIPVTPQDQIIIQQICDLAAMSANINRQMRVGIANWCVQWETRMQEKKEDKK